MEQMGQSVVEDAAGGAVDTVVSGSVAAARGVGVLVRAVLSSGKSEVLFLLPSEDSVLDDDEEGVGELRYCGIS
jgi:hypothetical protein